MPRFIKNYEITGELGAGHYGQVYMAVGEVPGRGLHPAKRRVVAIKKLRDPDPESESLLIQEFALLDQVKHRSILRVFEYLEDEDAVVMEMVHGVTLRTVLDECAKQREQVFTEAAIEIGCELADALYQAYTTPGDNGEKLQLVHRDLKPENVMITRTGEVKILDFGLARVDNADFQKDDPNRIKGTPVYMAPEQARGEDVDHRSDLFALGLILYELLMNRPAYRVPMDAPDPVAAVFAAIEGGELSEQCRELESKLPGMGPILAKLLQSRPRGRYQTGQDLLVDLRRQLYKDRGVYLKEFCDFFFGSLYRLPDLPDADPGQGGTRMSTNEKAPRKSMEERLRESMSNAAAPPPAAEGEGVPKAPVPVRRVAPPPVRPATPVVVAAPVAPKIVPRTASAARMPPRPEDDDIVPPSVKGAKPPSRPASTAPRNVGSRSPNETGMLQMMPLSDNADEKEAGADPSATAFFAIPAPKAERPKSVSSNPAPVGPASLGPGSPPSSRPAFTPPPAYNPVPMSGGGGPPQSLGPQPLVQGPVVSYGGAAGNPTPFHVAGPTPTANNNADSRVQSARVYAVLLGVFALACLAVVTVVFLYLMHERDVEKLAAETPPVVATIVPPKPASHTRDTATGPPKQPKPDPGPVKPRTPRPPSATGTTTTAKPVGAKAPVTVNFSGSVMPTSVEISCASGFRQRKALSGGSVTVADVPTGETCSLFPKGGGAPTSTPVRGGGTYNCAIIGTTTSCK